MSYQKEYRESIENPEAFWSRQAELITWYEKPKSILSQDEKGFYHWFKGGKLNTSYLALDFHVENGRAEQAALIYDSPVTETVRSYTYRELLDEVARFAGVLQNQGVEKGDRVIIYMPMIPEAVVAMLACARLGAIHSVVFGGFAPNELAIRIDDAKPKALVTASCGIEFTNIIEYKPLVDEALRISSHAPETVILLQRSQAKASMQAGRDFDWNDLMSSANPVDPVPVDATDPLYILYTSGSTGKPKGVVHTTGGYNLWSHLTFKWIFDLKDEDIYWCTADVGWITGHSYIVYGPLSNGATTLMYEGVPRPSNLGAFWEIVQKYKVSIFYTAPTAIRAFMKSGREIPDKYNLESLRLLGTVGEPINPEAWMWYKDVIGKNKCPIVDTWWQTETGGVMISPLPGVVATKPGSATFPLPGIEVEIVDKNGNKVNENEGGYLIIKKPWPGMMRTIHGNSERYLESYWEYISFIGEKFVYFAGDGARIDEDGYIWIMGRVDDVISVSGHRLGTMEIESALVSHKSVAESAVVGKKDDLKGEVIVAFVSLEKDVNGSSELVEDLKKHVVNEIGIIAKPEKIIISDSLPKTRSGKIMRRILRSLAAGEKISGDISTLEDSSVLEKLKELS